MNCGLKIWASRKTDIFGAYESEIVGSIGNRIFLHNEEYGLLLQKSRHAFKRVCFYFY